MDNKTKDGSTKALVADDDIPTRLLLRTAMVQWGYDVVEAANGEEAWQILVTANPPHLLVVDWMMPIMDGLTLCKQIRDQLKNSFYIILLTQLTGSTNITQALEAGADEFLSKPFNMAELRNRLSIGTRMLAYENKIAALQSQSKQIKELLASSQTLNKTETEQQLIQRLTTILNDS